METVEVVVKIPKDSFEFWQKVKQTKEVRIGYWETAISNGILLPKNHGRLIDAEQLMNYCQNQIDGHKYADCNVIARFPIVLDAEVENDD